MSCSAAARPRPSAEPVMKMRVMSPSGRGVSRRPLWRRGAPERSRRLGSGVGACELPVAAARRREVLGEEFLERVERDQVGVVVEVDVAGVGDVVELLGVGGGLVDVLAEVARMRLVAG